MPDPLITPNLGLPYIAAAQAQKHVTHNEALRRLDGLVQLVVEAMAATTPPSSPAEGARYLLGTAPTGAWLGRGGDLAVFIDGAWMFMTPAIGTVAYDKATEDLMVLKTAGWAAV